MGAPLRDRAAAANNQPSTDVATRENSGVERTEDKPTLAQLIDRMRPEIERALPSHLTADRMARIATTVLRQTPALAQCTPESFLGALMTASQLGLEPGPLGEAYLVPFGRVCTFIAGYRGLIKLAYQSDRIASIYAESVHEHDYFKRVYGTARRIEHEPPPLGQARGAAIAWYAVAKLKDGSDPVFVVLDRAEVDAIRARSRASGNGPWVTDYNAMAKKSCVRQLSKWVPLSPELASALAHDGRVRIDLSKEALDAPGEYVAGEVVDEATGEITATVAEVPGDGESADRQDVTWPAVAQPGSAGAES